MVLYPLQQCDQKDPQQTVACAVRTRRYWNLEYGQKQTYTEHSGTPIRRPSCTAKFRDLPSQPASQSGHCPVLPRSAFPSSNPSTTPISPTVTATPWATVTRAC